MIALLLKAVNKPSPKPKEETDRFAGLLSILAEHNPDCKFGPDDIDPDATVSFKAGTFVGSGRVTSKGRHGVTVEDDDARTHSVHWHEITGHKPAENSKGKGPRKGDAGE